MKNRIQILGVFILFLFIGMPLSHAEDGLGKYTWADKLGRGAVNVVSSPVEIARTIVVTSDVKGAGYGWTVGLVHGIGRTIVRLGVGIVDIVTSPFDFPKENKAPLIEPEYVWQKWDAAYMA